MPPRVGGAVAYVEDAVPETARGAGHPRSLAVLRELAAIADEVLVVPTMSLPPIAVVADALPANVVVADGPPLEALSRVLATHPRRVRLVWVARPNNMAAVANLHARAPDLFAGVRVVYDSEAIFARRDIARLALLGTPVSPGGAERMVRLELYPAEIAHAAAAVSQEECAVLRHRLACQVEWLGYPAASTLSATSFARRSGVLFVGAADDPDSPNGDGLRYLLEEVWPLLAAGAPTLTLVGRGCEPGGWLSRYVGPGIRLTGPVADLTSLFDRARVFVAPTRFAAGIPIKVLDAARHGVPAVATPLLGQQLGWQDDIAILLADSAADFAAAIARLHDDEAAWLRVRQGAAAMLARDFDPDAFRHCVHRLAIG